MTIIKKAEGFDRLFMFYTTTIVVILLMIAGCDSTATGNVVSEKDKFDVITIGKAGSFSSEDCVQRKLEDKIIMIESKYCGHCKQTLPVFEGACKEKGVEPIILDISVPEQRKQMESYGINVMYTPTFIFGCDYFVGSRSKEDYLSLLEE